MVIMVTTLIGGGITVSRPSAASITIVAVVIWLMANAPFMKLAQTAAVTFYLAPLPAWMPFTKSALNKHKPFSPSLPTSWETNNSSYPDFRGGSQQN
jgi:hypothetical protein